MTSPEQPPEDLWSSILDSVSSKRSVPSRQIILLGDTASGRSTIAAGLLNKQPRASSQDFALGYDWADVRDDADEDTLARLSVYTVPSPLRAYLSIVEPFLAPQTAIPNSVALILLDWTRPWSFVSQLQVWLTWLESWSRTTQNSQHDLQVVKEEGRERCIDSVPHLNA